MERKYRGQKKTMLVLSIVGILLIAVIIFFQIRIGNVKAEQEEYWAEEMVRLNQEVADAQAEYEANGYEAKEDELKAQAKDLKNYSKDLVKAFEKGEDIQAVIDEYEAADAE